jgi:hypothetical protein
MKTLLSLLALVLTPGVSEAQDPRLTGRLDPATLNAVVAFIDSSRHDGLPSEPLVQKALEGASKGAPGVRIVAAVRNLADMMRTARSALGTQSSEQELVAGAAALRAGAAPDALGNLRRVRSSQGLAVPLAVLADLVALGVKVDVAYQSVLDLARSEATDEDFIRLKQRSQETPRP